MAYGKAIELFFVSGKTDGLVTAELSNWNGKAIKIPRVEVEACNRDDLAGIGVYFLLCLEEDGSESVYIGEAENIKERLVQHIRDHKAGRETYYWSTAIAFIGRDLNKASIRYLENRFFNTAKECRRMTVLTKNSYKRTVMKESQIAVMEEFGDNVETLLGALGCQALEPAAPDKPTDSTTYLYCKSSSGATAQGFASAGGFTVLAGSSVSNGVAPSMEGTSYGLLRHQLERSKTVEKGVFTQNYEFRSPSAASSVVLGRNSNGNVDWKTKDGHKLGEL